jgi:hypothetical protein
MSADLINLRRVRKTRARADRDAQAAENRARFGRSKAERHHSTASADLDRRRLDAAQIDKPAPDDKTSSS